MSSSVSDSSENQLETPKPEGRRTWFPFLWVGVIGSLAAIMQLSGADQDLKNLSLVIAIGVLLLGLSIWFIRSGPASLGKRWCIGLLPWVAIAVFSSVIELVNNGDVGFVGWRWRWAETHDEKLELPESTVETIDDWASTERDYPRFLGNGYWAEVNGVTLDTNWKKTPPKELWRKEIGAGWSGFAIVGNYAVTQEQRGQHELVTCYDIRNGELVWSHADEARFDPGGTGALGGIGPRATPTIFKQRIITHGATGIVNCLDAHNGEVIWSHDTLKENNAENIMWGKAGSPLVYTGYDNQDLVAVSVGGKEGRSLVVYDFLSGEEFWAAGDRRSSYASPIYAEMQGQPQLVVVNEEYITAHDSHTGEVLWEYPWPGNSDSDATVSQPIPLVGDQIFFSKGYGHGCSLAQVVRVDEGKMMAIPKWKPEVKRVMKTKMCNVVKHNSYIYGMDSGILQCISLKSGESHWKKRRRPAIGHGQIMKIGDVLLILTESGELVIVEPSPNKYRELASFQALNEDKISWNNPAFSAPYLLVRNSEEVACYELPLLESEVAAEDVDE